MGFPGKMPEHQSASLPREHVKAQKNKNKKKPSGSCLSVWRGEFQAKSTKQWSYSADKNFLTGGQLRSTWPLWTSYMKWEVAVTTSQSCQAKVMIFYIMIFLYHIHPESHWCAVFIFWFAKRSSSKGQSWEFTFIVKIHIGMSMMICFTI